MKGLRSPLPLALAVLACLGINGSVDGHGLARRAADPNSFIRHRYPSVVAFGNYVYIDGGQMFRPNNENGTNSTQLDPYTPYAVNSTLSLDLTESWTSETVGIRSIPKTAPLFGQQVLWSDHSYNPGGFSVWGGMTMDNEPPPEDQFWYFHTDGSGGGSWEQAPLGDYRQFTQLLRPAGASFAQSATTGYAFGGLATRETDHTIQKAYPGYAAKGVISYDFNSGRWANHSSDSFGQYGTSLYGCAEYVPFGPNGLLIFLGGAETPVDATAEYISGVGWTTLTLYDPVTRKWYTQKTTGWGPPQIERACSVGVRGPENTYEIFIYGGSSANYGDTSSDVYVLSLPGFVFFKSNAPGTPRADHGCAVVGKGKRQMLSYGGVDAGQWLRFSNMTKDPWKQGLGVYDMTEMAWTNSYDVDAANYESPAVVKDWYSQGGMKTMTWDNDELKELFVNGSSRYDMMNNSSITKEPPKSTLSSAQRTGAIVGGVVGGIVVLTAVGAAIFLMRRRRRRRQSSQASSTINEYRPEPWPKDSPRMRSTTPGTIMTFGSSPTPVEPVEISGTTRGELPAEDVEWTYELPVPTPHATPRLRPELPDRKFPH
ncbi:hypothetical protein F5Y11DRAFT_254444 [Daldinia sp. FL1419]|nr:hypothetical protein F5Y11DRAFT_254444 [Daldinia sp. FL1419]